LSSQLLQVGGATAVMMMAGYQGAECDIWRMEQRWTDISGHWR